MAVRTPERVSRARALVQECDIRKWFRNLKTDMQNILALEIFNEPSRIFNLDETCIQLCPDTGKVISIRGKKNVYELAPGPEKSNLTFVGCFSADGEIVCPSIIYPYLRLPPDIAEKIPDTFFIGKSESGWMNAAVFYDFIGNALVPWI